MEKLYAGLKELANERRAKLDDALKLFMLNREVSFRFRFFESEYAQYISSYKDHLYEVQVLNPPEFKDHQ